MGWLLHGYKHVFYLVWETVDGEMMDAMVTLFIDHDLVNIVKWIFSDLLKWIIAYAAIALPLQIDEIFKWNLALWATKFTGVFIALSGSYHGV